MKRLLFCGLVLVIGSNLTFAPSASAKPSDLPTDHQIQCPDCGEPTQRGSLSIKLGVGAGGIKLEVEVSKAPAAEPTAAIDTVTPVYVEQLIKLANEWFAGKEIAAEKAIANLGNEDRQAVRLFQIAEWYRRVGHLGQARNYFQHVHMLSPTTRLGQLAIDRLLQIEERLRDGTEQSEPNENVDPRETFRRMRDRTMPLGLVEVTY